VVAKEDHFQETCCRPIGTTYDPNHFTNLGLYTFYAIWPPLHSPRSSSKWKIVPEDAWAETWRRVWGGRKNFRMTF